MRKITLFIKLTISTLLIILASTSYAGSKNNPWPEIRQQRIQSLLAPAMQKAGVDAWISLCRENNNDPIADHIGCENAGSQAAFVFISHEGKLQSLVFSPEGEAQALIDLGQHDKVFSIPRGEQSIDHLATFLAQQKLHKIAVNSSPNNAQADGLSYSQRIALEAALGQKLSAKLVSSESLIYHWLSLKLAPEVEIMTQAAALSAKWQLEAYATIVPGKTTDADLAAFLKEKMREAGVKDAWAPDQNPNVNSGPDRGHSHATTKVIMPGDIIQIDFGVKLHNRWVSDIQRFAYVLREGETKPPQNIQHYWNSAKAGNRAAFNAMKPGVAGYQVDAAQRELMQKNGSEPVMWSTGHPVGYVAHDTGPNLGGSMQPEVRPASRKLLSEGMVFAFDGFHSWKRDDGTFKTISVEEMVLITKTGARYLIEPQEELVLISSGE